MSMTSIKMKRILEKQLSGPDFRTSYNHKNDEFRIEWRKSRKGVTIKLPQLINKYNAQGEEAVDELVKDIKEALKLMNEEHRLKGLEKQIFPVLRSTSFPTKSKDRQLVTTDHTAETRIYYALDLETSYRIIDQSMIEEANWTKEMLHEMAMFNLRSLNNNYTIDEVNENKFYFIATQDGYDASRILNEPFLEEMAEKVKGDMAIATPHQDVLIIADLQNDTGYDILAQMTMKFFSEGRVPITSLPFLYEEGYLEPIFIMARTRRKKDK